MNGQDTPDNPTKRQFLDEWVRAVNAHSGSGTWAWDVSVSQGDLPNIITKHCPASAAAPA